MEKYSNRLNSQANTIWEYAQYTPDKAIKDAYNEYKGSNE